MDTASDRLKEDEAKVQSILNNTEIEVRPLSVFRMGKPSPNRPRLLKVEFPSKSVVARLMRTKNRLKNNNSFNKVFIRPSLNRAQREARKILTQERIKKNAALDQDDRKNDPFILYGPPDDPKLIRRSDISKFKTNFQ